MRRKNKVVAKNKKEKDEMDRFLALIVAANALGWCIALDKDKKYITGMVIGTATYIEKTLKKMERKCSNKCSKTS